jgi:hypothetical protein
MPSRKHVGLSSPAGRKPDRNVDADGVDLDDHVEELLKPRYEESFATAISVEHDGEPATPTSVDPHASHAQMMPASGARRTTHGGAVP